MHAVASASRRCLAYTSRHVGVASPFRSCLRVGIASRRRLVVVASASRRLRVAKFSRWRHVSSRWHRLGVAPLQASRCRCGGVAAAKPSRRLSRLVGVKPFFACHRVGIALLTRADLAKASLRQHRNVVIASPSCRCRIAAVKPSRWRPVPSRRRRIDLESRRRRLAVLFACCRVAKFSRIIASASPRRRPLQASRRSQRRVAVSVASPLRSRHVGVAIASA